MTLCECCKEEQTKCHIGGFSLCRKCGEVAKQDMNTVRKLIAARQKKKIDEALDSLKGD